jgi:hypothetical protein
MANPIRHYVARWSITGEQGEAGECFAADYAAARRWLETRDLADREGAERCRRACRELGELRHVVIAVAVRKIWASKWAQQQGHPEGDGLPLLKLGLDALIRIYAEKRQAA